MRQMRFGKKKASERVTGTTDKWVKNATIKGRYTYNIIGKLAEGGMGEIWLVDPIDEYMLERKSPYMAVKNLKAEWIDDDVFAENQVYSRFYKECEAWINLENHPNIVRCFYVERVLDLPR